jgi:hypothetical protein
MASARGGALEALGTGRDRRQVVDALLRAVADEPATIVGLDFAFSWPRWYLDDRGLTGPEDAWAHAGALAGRPSRDLPPPFWGAGIRRRADAGLDGREPYRVTETAPSAAAAGARSTFHAGGAGTVGLQSIRGMPHLAALRRAGVAIWPFDRPVAGAPVAVEVFPRMLARALVPDGGRGRGFRARVVDGLGREALAVRGARDLALTNQDAFDAATSALALSACSARDLELVGAAAAAARREGWIWRADLT